MRAWTTVPVTGKAEDLVVAMNRIEQSNKPGEPVKVIHQYFARSFGYDIFIYMDSIA
jgi:hypothetical protein